MHGPINVKSPNNTSKWQMGFNSAFKGLIRAQKPICHGLRRRHRDAQVCEELKMFWQLLPKTATELLANVTYD